jgi:hypothetical protein
LVGSRDSQRFPSGVQARIYFYAISFQSVNSKACGSKVATQLFYFLKND